MRGGEMSAVFLLKLGAALLLLVMMGAIWFLLWLFHHSNKPTDRVSPEWLLRERRGQ